MTFTPAVLVWLLLATIWGSTWLVIKLGLDSALPPFTLMWMRFAVAGLVLALASLPRLRHLPRTTRDRLLIVLTGNLLFSLNYTCVYWAETRISSALAAIVYTTLPLIGGVVAHFMLADEPLSPRKMFGAAMGLCGVALIFGEQITRSGGMIWGVCAILLAVFATSVASLMMKRYLSGHDPVVLTTCQIWSALPAMVILGLSVEGNPLAQAWSPATLGGVAYLGIMGTALTFALLTWLYGQMEVTKTQLIPLASTLIAVVLGLLVRGETHGPRTLLGGAIILIGLVYAARARRVVRPRPA